MDHVLGADVHAFCRLVEDKRAGMGEEPFGEDDLLLVAAREVVHAFGDVVIPDVQRLEYPPGLVLFPRTLDDAIGKNAIKRRHRGVFVQAHPERQALRRAILGDEAKPCPERRVRVADVQRGAVQGHAAAGRARDAEDGLGQFCPARADKAEKPENLPLPELERNIPHELSPRQVLHVEQNMICRMVRRPVVDVAQIPADHHPDEDVGVDFRDVLRADVFAVPEHRHPVGDGEDFVELVGDEDDSHAVGLELPHDVEERPGLLDGEGGRRLVHEEDADVFPRERLGDFHNLAFGDGEGLDFRVGGDVPRLEVVEKAACRIVGFFPVHQPPFCREGGVFEKDVFRHGQIGEEAQFLMDDRHPVFLRDGGVPASDVFAVQKHLAGIGLIDSGDGAEQRGLSRAVLAQEGVYFPRPEREIDVPERLHAGKAFGDLAHFEDVLGHGVSLELRLYIVVYTIQHTSSRRGIVCSAPNEVKPGQG